MLKDGKNEEVVQESRVLCDIQEENVIVLVLTIGHRRQVYKREQLTAS